ncbi:hypothetical protein ABPG74_005892 [Tetrahymena malaccensis]
MISIPNSINNSDQNGGLQQDPQNSSQQTHDYTTYNQIIQQLRDENANLKLKLTELNDQLVKQQSQPKQQQNSANENLVQKSENSNEQTFQQHNAINKNLINEQDPTNEFIQKSDNFNQQTTQQQNAANENLFKEQNPTNERSNHYQDNLGELPIQQQSSFCNKCNIF